MEIIDKSNEGTTEEAWVGQTECLKKKRSASTLI
jgi:hypothetical protein